MTPAVGLGEPCPVCGGVQQTDRGPRRFIKRGALVMRSDPVEFEWNGQPVTLSPMELTLMVAVMLQGRATLTELGALLPLASRRVVMHKIRAKFHQLGAADPLQTVPNWGLMLRVEADNTGTKSTWIGIDESFEAAPPAAPLGTPPLTKQGLEDAGLLARPHLRPPS